MICGSSKPKNENQEEEVEGFQSAHAEPSSKRKMEEEEEKLSESPMVKKLCFEEQAKSRDRRSGPFNLEDYLISEDSDDDDYDDDDSDQEIAPFNFNQDFFRYPQYPSQILPPFDDYDDELFIMLRQSCKNALAEYNKENVTNYKFSGYVETEYKIQGAGYRYRITFEAKQPPFNKSTTFEATVHQLFSGESKLKAYRLVD